MGIDEMGSRQSGTTLIVGTHKNSLSVVVLTCAHTLQVFSKNKINSTFVHL